MRAAPDLTEEDAAVAALAGLPYQSWDRIRRLLNGRSPVEAWRAVGRGEHGAALARAAAGVDLAEVAAAHAARGVTLRRHGSTGYPACLADDHEAPPVLFWWGSLDALARPRVAIIGTRRCTNYGRDVARQFGRELAEAGVAVVSGLAAGIDGAAHDGALAGGGAPPIGVVGSGLDVVYPRRHAVLWQRVAQAGVLMTEAPLGARPEPWRFPARNRILAALAHVVVVVESNVRGGSMHTVCAAEERGVPVLAVPGPIRSRSSGGTNQLLSQGCHPVCDVDDVLAALALALPAAGRDVFGATGDGEGGDGSAGGTGGTGTGRAGGTGGTGTGQAGTGRTGGTATGPGDGEASTGHAGAAGGLGPVVLERPLTPADFRAEPSPEIAAVLDAVDWTPTSLDEILARTSDPPPRISAALSWLEREGWVRNDAGWWSRC